MRRRGRLWSVPPLASDRSGLAVEGDLPGRVAEAAGPLRDVTVGAFGFVSNLIAVLAIAFLLILHGDRDLNAALSGTCAWIALTVLGVPFALPLAIVIGFFDLLPMVGATLGAIIVALAALLVSPLTAVIWLVYVFVYQQAEN
jgi:hypothetical protein